ncbi:MAG: cation transporter [Proteobacteria bacterium]|nr:cation transporter [Pseudomonadota bacterium]
MKPTLVAIALLVGLGAGSAVATERTVTLAIENMTCASCPYVVKKTLAGIPGVRRVEVSFEAKTAAVIFDDVLTSTAALTRATAKAGYPAQVVQ